MEIVTELTPIQEDSILEFKRKWLSCFSLTQEVDVQATQIALSNLYEELGLSPPETFLTMQSPREAFNKLDEWKNLTGRLAPCFWNYQLPLCDPRSYWRTWGVNRENIHFGDKRRPNQNFCWSSLVQNSPKPTKVLSQLIHEKLWQAFALNDEKNNVYVNWCNAVIESFWEAYPTPSYVRYLEDIFHQEDPTSQIGVDDCIFLGPFAWLVHEVSCVDYCAAVLGVSRNAALYDSLETLLLNAGFIFTFEKLCIICERPVHFGEQIVFKDGYQIEYV